MAVYVELPVHCDLPYRIQARARKALRKGIKNHPEWKNNKLDANCIIEQVWNALVGHTLEH